ncbi:MAG: hypothetical protein ACI9VR_005362 [Cognaticolwellia sp.]|jgi:hypothetical protein
MTTLFTLLAACAGPAVQVQLPSDTGSYTPTGPFDSVYLVEQDSQVLTGTASFLQGGDVDGDGLADVGLVQDNRSLGWAQGGGEGALSPQSVIPDSLLITRIGETLGTDDVDPDSVFVQDLQLVDLDGDGRSEWLITASVQVDEIYSLLTMVLSDPLGEADLALVGPGEHQAQAVSDLDGDGLPELVLFGEDSAVYTSGGSVWPLSDAVDWNYYPQVAAMNLDGSGGRDLVVFLNGGFGISEIHPFYQENDALSPGPTNHEVFANEASISLPSGAEQEALLLTGEQVLRMNRDGLIEEIGAINGFYWAVHGDLDADGEMDLLQLTGQAPVLYASGPQGPLKSIPFQGPEQALDSAVVLDLNGDGRKDLVGTRWDSQNSTALLESWLNVSGD